MELGKKIKSLRLKAGLTQEELGEKLSLGAQAISKWENGMTMPDINQLPLIAEIFGVSIDDLFDLSVEQRFLRIENRMDLEDELPQDVYLEFEGFLRSQTENQEHKKKALELLAYLYWHRMNMFGKKASRYAKKAVELAPNEKTVQWVLQKAEGHAVWDWDVSNHTKAINFYRGIVERHPNDRLPYLYLLDNLIADRRAEEAERYLEKLSSLKEANPVQVEVYRANIALARFDEKKADAIVESLLKKDKDDSVILFEAAQYYAKKADYRKAISLYEESFEKEKRRPRYVDELLGIRDIQIILEEYQEAAKTCDRIIDLLKTEWGMNEGDEIKNHEAKKAELLGKAK